MHFCAIMETKYFLVTRFGAVPLDRFVTTIGRTNCNIKLHSAACSHRHGSFIFLPDGSLKLKNHSSTNLIFINDAKLEPGCYSIVSVGDVVSFSGVETFKICDEDITANLLPTSPSPD